MAKKTAAEKAAAKAALRAKRAAREAAKRRARGELTEEDEDEVKVEEDKQEDKVSSSSLTAFDVLNHASITGKLTSREDSRDVQIENFNITLYGRELVADTTLALNYGRRIGLIGGNGSGKSTLLMAIATRQIPIPDHIDIWHLHEEAKPSDRTAMECTIDTVKLEAKLTDLYERLDDLSPETFEMRAGELLFGLGFSQEMMNKATKDMSGGWRMRVALAQALLVEPKLLLLDEPTNHLDLGACVWLENYLSTYKKCLLVTSHSQDFLNTVCTNIIGTLEYWSGNYDTFIKTKSDKEINQLKRHRKEQDDIKRLKHFINTCDKVTEYNFNFPRCGALAPPVMSFKEVSFSYSGKKEDYLYTDLDFGVDLDSRVALVGPNGAGKSTLLKLMTGDLIATEGDVSRHSHLRISYYNQHSEDQLDLNLSPIQEKKQLTLEEWRSVLGITMYVFINNFTFIFFSLKILYLTNFKFDTFSHNTCPMPTNHLDMECIDSLARAINNFEGGLILVSHDFRLITQVASEIWVCDKGITKWTTGIRAYKKKLKADGESHIKKMMRLIMGKKRKDMNPAALHRKKQKAKQKKKMARDRKQDRDIRDLGKNLGKLTGEIEKLRAEQSKGELTHFQRKQLVSMVQLRVQEEVKQSRMNATKSVEPSTLNGRKKKSPYQNVYQSKTMPRQTNNQYPPGIPPPTNNQYPPGMPTPTNNQYPPGIPPPTNNQYPPG
eukprot:GSMAST32.ASY1.ANO1.1042.1 assembled CDS